MNPVVAALDEYGVPIQVGIKVTEMLGETDNLDAALEKLKNLDVNKLQLDPFETELLVDAKWFLP